MDFETDQSKAVSSTQSTINNDSLLTEEREKTDNIPAEFESEELVVLKPVPPTSYDLAYACLVIPRFASHILVGDLSIRLYDWLQQICLSYGWRLEYQNVQPDYLQWVFYIPPATPPAHFMRIVRKHTSSQIFEEFPRFQRENLSTDFWAPGYLAMLGNRPHPPEMIKGFIIMTRRQQGLLG